MLLNKKQYASPLEYSEKFHGRTYKFERLAEIKMKKMFKSTM
jgi:hypothetical protein